VRTDTGALAVTVDATFDEVPSPDVVVVPGGPGTRALLEPGRLHEWIRAVHPGTQWTTSVCTGALVLGAAGLLDGLEATTHWGALDELAPLCGTVVGDRRIVQQGKIVTAAGVSAGIDMALWLVARIAGDDMSRAIQLGIEYDPQPPFDAGSTAKAGPELVALLRDLVVDRPPAGDPAAARAAQAG
jgi:transcriptional regulator GlxA family with amidase domain